MGFVGRLEDLSLTDIFQVLSLGRRTGKLTLTKRKQQGLIVFLNGGIVYCQSNSVHETLGSILVNRHMIDESTLLAALDQQQAGEERPLGSILVEMGSITQETLQKIVREQVKTVLSELLSWESGVFQFEPVELPDGFSTALDANEFLVEEGLSPEEVVLELLTQLDEMRVGLRSSGEDQSGTQPDPAELQIIVGGAKPSNSPDPRTRARGFASLKAIMTELRSRPFTFTGEITLMLLRYTAELVNRAVLFAVRGDHFVGIGQFGIELDGDSADNRVRQIAIPADHQSVLQEVVAKKEPFRGRLARTSWNSYLVQQLGGRMPREVIAVPIVADDETVAVIYGDNLPDETLIGPIEGLELLMIEAGLIIEKHRLQSRLRGLDLGLDE